ncbi:ATP-binding protein [Lentzea sp. NPDC005914]|uniref:ATP-binding protein n=1 Tax=Lentzea sp. NPDC005914 TaxID=3154572 RepID=UPI0033E4AB68
MRSSWCGRATLVGREQELTELCTGLRAVEAGGADAVLLDGPAGIGKSRLLVEVVDLARRDGFRVLVARASAAERSFAFGVAGQLLEPLLLSLPAAQRDEVLAGPAALASQVLNLAVPGEARAERSLDAYAALHALYRLVAALSTRQPVLVAVDDVEQADAPSLRWLAYLVRRLGSVRVAVVMTQCTGTRGGRSSGGRWSARWGSGNSQAACCLTWATFPARRPLVVGSTILPDSAVGSFHHPEQPLTQG